MATAPTLVATYGGAAPSATTPKTASVTVAAGDLLVLVGLTADSAVTLSTPTGGLTWTLAQSVVGLGGYGNAYVWTAPATAPATFTLSVAGSGGNGVFTWIAYRFGANGGVGVSGKANASGAPSLTATTTGPNSALVVGNVDWNALDGTSRTWRTSAGAFTEKFYGINSNMTGYGGLHPDVGAAGSKTVGLSSPSGQAYSIVALEVLAATTTTQTGAVSAAGAGTATVAGSDTVPATVTAAGTGTGAVTGSQTASASVAAAGTGAASVIPAGPTAAPSAAGAGTATVGGARTAVSAVTSAGTGTATVAGSDTVPGAVTAAGAGSASVAAFQSASLAAAGAGSATVAGTLTVRVTVNAAGVGGATATGTRTALATAAAAGAGSASIVSFGTLIAALTAIGVGSGTVTAPSVVTPPIVYPPIGLPGRPRWAFAVGDWHGLPTRELTAATQRSCKLRLTGRSEVTLTLDGTTGEAAAVQELVSDLWVMRNGFTLFRGRVGGTVDALDGTRHAVQVTSGDYRAVLLRRILLDSDQLTYTAQDPASIMWALVSATQARTGGSLGIVNGTTPVGVSRTVTYPAGQGVGEAIEQLSLMDDGYNWDVLPATGSTALTLTTWRSRGEARGKVLDYPGRIASLTRTVNPDVYANSIRESGNTGLAAVSVTASDVATRGEGRWETQLGDTALLDAASVTARANYDLAQRQQIVPTYQVKLYPGAWGGPLDVWLGDVVHLSVLSGRLAVDTSLRVWEVDIDLDDADNETVTLTLAALDPFKRARSWQVLYRLTNLERR